MAPCSTSTATAAAIAVCAAQSQSLPEQEQEQELLVLPTSTVVETSSSTSAFASQLGGGEEMEKRHRVKFNAVTCLLSAAILACLLPRPAGAAGAEKDGRVLAPAPAAAGTITHHADAGLPPPPTAGGDLLQPSLPPTQPGPHFGFPLQPTFGSAAAPSAGGDGGYPFIGSNPSVPLPTGMTDTATVLPLPDTATTKVVGLAASVVRAQLSMIGLGVTFAIVFSCL